VAVAAQLLPSEFLSIDAATPLMQAPQVTRRRPAGDLCVVRRDGIGGWHGEAHANRARVSGRRGPSAAAFEGNQPSLPWAHGFAT